MAVLFEEELKRKVGASGEVTQECRVCKNRFVSKVPQFEPCPECMEKWHASPRGIEVANAIAYIGTPEWQRENPGVDPDEAAFQLEDAWVEMLPEDAR